VVPEIFELLDFDDDTAFLYPTAFAHAVAIKPSSADLALAYVGAVPSERRPLAFTAMADEGGHLFLPGLGYLSGLPDSTSVEIRRDDTSPIGYSPVA
jgi:hypothetical protein